MRINDFFAVSAFAHRNYTNHMNSMSQSAMRMSTGYRINSAADDAAGLAISEKMRSQIRGLNMAARNVRDAQSLIQTAESELATINDILNRMRELATQAATGSLQEFDRMQAAKEFDQLKQEINDIANQGNFNNMPLFGDGSHASAATVGIGADVRDVADNKKQTVVTMESFKLHAGDIVKFSIKDADGNVTEKQFTYGEGDTMEKILEKLGLDEGTYTRNGNTLVMDGEVEVGFVASPTRPKNDELVYRIQTGALQNQQTEVRIPIINTNTLGLDGVDIFDQDSAGAAITAVKAAQEKVIDARTTLGAMNNRMQYKYNNLTNQALNLSEAESRIRDVDIAAEMTNYVRSQMLMQVATAMMAQMNQQATRVLELLK